jgi:hypothetical protein
MRSETGFVRIYPIKKIAFKFGVEEFATEISEITETNP